MKQWFLFIFLSMALNCHAQEYKLSYDQYSIPELYNSIQVIVEEAGADNKFIPISGKYKLQANDAKFIGSRIEFYREQLHRNNGIINCTLTYKGKTHLLPLALPVLKEIRIKPYADSIKPVMNYYLNVEGIFNNGKIYPLDINHVSITASNGTIQGMEWVKPDKIDFDKVIFTAICTYDATITTGKTVYIKKAEEE